jgi:hypothetical protein
MKNPMQVFEMIMKLNGHTDFEKKGDKYVSTSMQMRWKYFLMGWEMRGGKL